MHTLLRMNPSAPALYEVDYTDAGIWTAFVIVPEVVPPPPWGYFPVSSPWAPVASLPQYAGYFVFAPHPPSNPALFLEALLSDPITSKFADWTMPLWIIDPDAAPLNPIAILMSNGQILAGTNIGFGGNFSFLIPTNSYYAADPANDALTITAQQRFLFAVNNKSIPGFDPSLTIPLTGPQAGLLCLGAKISFDPTQNGGDLAFHYNYYTADDVVQVRYPLFDIGAAGPTFSVNVTLDPSAPFDSMRTRFAFRNETLGASIGTGLQTPLGQRVTLAPLQGSGFVIRAIFGSTGAASAANSGFEPDGPFAIVADESAMEDGPALMPGLSGSENFTIDGSTILNFVGGPSYYPFDPESETTNPAGGLVDENGAAVTAWVAVEAENGTVTYSSQPPQSGFFLASPSTAPYVLLNVALPTAQATKLPAVPFTACALIDDQLGSTTDITSYEAFERHAAVSRRDALLGPSTARPLRPRQQNTVPPTVATARGLVLSSQNGGKDYTSLTLAVTVDANGNQHTWSLENMGPQITQALQAPSVFLVIDRKQYNGSPLFTIAGSVAYADWQMTLDLDPLIHADGPPQMLIFKFGGGSLSTLAAQLGAWTDAAIFCSDPQATQTALLGLINDIRAKATGPDKQIAALYQTVAGYLDDASWNGVLAITPLVVAMPDVVAGIVSAVPGDQLTSVVMGVAVNSLAGGGASQPNIASSAPFSVVDYEAPPPSQGGAQTGDVLADFLVNFIRVKFQNGAVASFAAQGQLTINELFGLPVARQVTAGTDAVSNAITIVGSYQNPTQPGGPGTYSFVSAQPTNFRFAYDWFQGNATATILQSINVQSVQFLPISENSQSSESRFAMSGAITFAPPAATTTPPGLTIGADLFDFNSLQFRNLGLVMTETSTSTALSWALDVTQALLSAQAGDMRAGLAFDLPLVLSRLVDSGTLAQYGCEALEVAQGWTAPVSSFDYAMIFSLDMGQLGSFSTSASHLNATLVLGWTAHGDYALGFGINGLGQQRQLTLQGVIQLTIGPILVAVLPESSATRVSLVLRQCQLGFLGTAFPSQVTRFELALIGSPPYPATQLLWFAADGVLIPAEAVS